MNLEVLAVRGPNWQLHRNGASRALSFGFNEQKTSNYRRIDSKKAVDDGKWHLVVATYRRLPSERPVAQAQLFIDGQPVIGVSGPPIEHEKPESIRIGGAARSDRTFNGRIDEISIFKRSLRADEIRRMYDSGKP